MPRLRPTRIGPRRLNALILATALGVSGLEVSSALRVPGAVATTSTSGNMLAGDQGNFDGGTYFGVRCAGSRSTNSVTSAVVSATS